ncbi:tail sheath [Vibrio phage D81]
MDINKIIPIVVRISPKGLQTSNYGKLMLVCQTTDPKSTANLGAYDYRDYGDLTALSKDFDEASETYKAAKAWFGVVPQPLSITVGVRDQINDSPETSLNKLRNKVWFYWLAFTRELYADNDGVKACATWGSANSSFFINCQTVSALTEQSDTDTIADQLNAIGPRRCFTEYNDGSESQDAYAGIATAALFARVKFSNPDSTITAEYKVKTGITSMNLDEDKENALIKKKVVFYTDVTAGESTDKGNTKNTITHSAYGEWIDDVFNLDGFVNYMQVELQKTLRGAVSKIGQTPRGQKRLIGKAIRVCELFIDNGYLGARTYQNPDTGIEDTTRGYEMLTLPEDVLTITDSDRDGRRMAPIRVRLFRAGAAHVVDVTVDVY